MEVKVCSKKDCEFVGQKQSLDSFQKRKNKLQSICRVCRRLESLEYYYKNKEKMNEQHRMYCEENKEKIIEQRKVYNQRHQEESKIYRERYNKDHEEELKEYYKSPERRFIAYKSRSKRKNIIFEIGFDFAKSLFLSNCFYCGKKGAPTNGIDRKDCIVGYVESNCVPCCKICNTMKLNYSVDDFLNHISEIFERKDQIKG